MIRICLPKSTSPTRGVALERTKWGRNVLTVGDFEVGWNTRLSAGDIVFLNYMYPFPYGASLPMVASN